MPLARMAAPIAINTTGHTYPGRRSKTSSCSRRNTTPSTTNTTPAKSAERLYLASIDGHLPDAHRELEPERPGAARVGRRHGKVHVEPTVGSAEDRDLAEPGSATGVDRNGGHADDQFAHAHPRLHDDDGRPHLNVAQVDSELPDGQVVATVEVGQ